MTNLFPMAFGFSPGFGEMFLICAALLLLFGAKNVPKIARNIGKTMEDLRRATRDVTDEIMRADQDVTSTLKSLPGEILGDDHDESWYQDEDHYHDDHDSYHDEYHHDDHDPYHDAEGHVIDVAASATDSKDDAADGGESSPKAEGAEVADAGEDPPADSSSGDDQPAGPKEAETTAPPDGETVSRKASGGDKK